MLPRNQIRSFTKYISVVFLFLSSLAFAGEDWIPQPIGPFSGVNNRDSSFAIPAQNAQDALNVNVTPGGKSVFKRKGFGLAFTLPITTAAVHGIYTFFDANGNTVDLFANDAYLSGSVGGATPTTIFSNGPNGATYQCTDTLGFAYCANSSRTTLIKTNGVTSSQINNVSSTGTMVTTCVTRLAMAGFSDRPSGIDFSADSDFTTWGFGSLGTSAVQLTVSAPGSKITGIIYAFGRLMWFKDSSFGYVLIGNQPSQTDWVIKTVSFDVGTNDNSFVYREGILYFRGQDGHIYAFDGSSYQRVSREIAGTIATEQNKTQGSWTQTSQSDWSNGFNNNSNYIDTTTSAGNVQLTFPDNFNTLRDGSNGSRLVWASYQDPGFPSASTTAAVSNGNLVITSSNSVEQFLTGLISSNNYKAGTTYYMLVSTITPNALAGHSILSLVVSSAPTHKPVFSNDFFQLTFVSTATGIMKINQISDSTDGTICSSCGGAIITLPASVSLWLSTSNYSVSANGVLLKSGSHTYTNNRLYTTLSYFGADAPAQSASIDSFGFSVETATYYSAVKNAASLRTWDSFNATIQNNGGTQNLFIRSSTNSISVNSSTPSWTSINSGQSPSISTGTYFQFRDDFSITAATQQPILSDLTQNWFEGSAADKSYATYFDDKIWFEVTAGTTGATTNNKTLIYDMLNQTWTLYDLATNGFLVRQNKLYFGSSAGGYIYKFGDTDNDNGAAINAYWKSKDFFGGNPFTNQELANISIVTKEVDTSSMTVTYSINGSSDVSYVVPLYARNSLFMNKNKNIPGGTVAGDFNVKFGNNAADQPFEVYGIQVGIRPKTWIPN